MTMLERYQGQRIGILGLGKSGRAAAVAFDAAGAEVVLFDDRAHAMAGLPGSAGTPASVGSLDLLVASPGIPLTHPQPHPAIEAAHNAGVAIRGDIDLFAEAIAPRKIVGVTGTNGKSTTTALIHHLLMVAGLDSVLGGNIGEPVLQLDPGGPDRIFVLELSSFQLDLASSLHCDVAVWLNITADHLDRHGNLEGYVKAKRRIFMHQHAGDAAVVGVDDRPSRMVFSQLRGSGARVIPISTASAPDGGIYVDRGILFDAMEGPAAAITEIGALSTLRGEHNWQNATAAYAAVRLLGLNSDAASAGFSSFPGLPHRMAEITRLGPVLFVNDSKATNIEAASRSLRCFDNIFWIAGGRAKPGGFRDLLPHLDRVRAAFLIGEAAAELGNAIDDRLPTTNCGTLEAAVARATTAALQSGLKEAVVLLAPACASFDQFANFEARGERFEALVEELAEPRRNVAGGAS